MHHLAHQVVWPVLQIPIPRPVLAAVPLVPLILPLPQAQQRVARTDIESHWGLTYVLFAQKGLMPPKDHRCVLFAVQEHIMQM